RVNEMLLSRPVDQCVEKQSSGREIDNRCAGDTDRINITAGKTLSNSRSDVCTLPDYCPGSRVQRINIIRFSHGNNHWAVWAVFDVKRLGITVAGNRAIK